PSIPLPRTYTGGARSRQWTEPRTSTSGRAPHAGERGWMKIGLILPAFSASDRDWAIPVLLTLVRALAARHDVRVFPLRYPFTARPYVVDQAAVFPIGGGNARGAARLPLLRRAMATVVRAHHTEPFDVLHALWAARSEEHTSELQSRENLVCRLLLEKKNAQTAPDA